MHAPTGTVVGHDALDKFAGDLRSMHPHYVYAPSGEPQVLQDSARLAWGSGPRGEPPRYTGEDFILVRNGKIAALYVYLDSPPRLILLRNRFFYRAADAGASSPSDFNQAQERLPWIPPVMLPSLAGC